MAAMRTKTTGNRVVSTCVNVVAAAPDVILPPIKPPVLGTAAPEVPFGDPKAEALEALLQNGVSKEAALTALEAVQKDTINAEQWTEKAEVWLAEQDELEEYKQQLAVAMQTSLEEAEQQKKKEKPLAERSDQELYEHFKGSAILEQVQDMPSQAGRFWLPPCPVRTALLQLLELERKARRWYPCRGAELHFKAIGADCARRLQCVSDSGRAKPIPATCAAAASAAAPAAASPPAAGSAATPPEPASMASGTSTTPAAAKARTGRRKPPAKRQKVTPSVAGREPEPDGAKAGGQRQHRGVYKPKRLQKLAEYIMQQVHKAEQELYAMPAVSGQLPAVFQQLQSDSPEHDDECLVTGMNDPVATEQLPQVIA